MSAGIEWSGLDELRAALKKLPAEMRDDAREIVEDAAERTAASLKQSYPLGDTGNLRAGVSVQTTTEHDQGFGIGAVVRSKSPHAHLWEFGTQIRKTRQGWNRGKGPEHLRQGLVPIAQRERRKMHSQLVELLKRAGFEVTGAI